MRWGGAELEAGGGKRRAGGGKGGRAAGKAEQVVNGRRRASLEKGVDEDGTRKGQAEMSRDKYSRGHLTSQARCRRERALDGAELVLGGPWKRGREKRKRAGRRQGKAGCRNEREGVGSGGGNGNVERDGGQEAVQGSRKQRNRRGIPKGRTNNSDKHRSSLPNPGRENASRGRVGRYPPGERRGEIAIWGRAGWAVAGGGDPASARAPAWGISGDYPNRFSSR
ncbi:hypothetical protein B0H14DRAFT_2560679 [Mycena olivaceomarginata]|nr:hypothetical protein B0H14DRAFT_2560679 [Mycena olivaceomarginata]